MKLKLLLFVLFVVLVCAEAEAATIASIAAVRLATLKSRGPHMFQILKLVIGPATAALGPYLRFYNHRRPHASLGRRSPWMRFQEAA